MVDGPVKVRAVPSPYLLAASGQFERILDVLGEAVTVTEADGQLVFANAAALERIPALLAKAA